MSTAVYGYQIEGPHGERWSGAMVEGEVVKFMPYAGDPNGTWKVTYWEMKPEHPTGDGK